MNCEVQRVYKNPRYRILIIEEEKYILDLGQSFWNVLFPFLFWMLPISVFKVDDPEIWRGLKEPQSKQSNIGISVILFVGGLSVLLGQHLIPLMVGVF